MTRNQQFLVIFCALLLVEGGGARADVVATNPSAISNALVDLNHTVTLTFSTPISNATELLSIGGGTVFDAEGGTFLLDVKYSDGTTQQIFSDSSIPVGGAALQLDTITDKSFTEGTVTALLFEAPSSSGFAFQLNVPEGTTFDFATASVSAVPEPSSLTLFGAALAFLAAIWRRRTRHGSSPT